MVICSVSCISVYVCALTAPSMMRTMSHRKVQMLMLEGGFWGGSCSSLHRGHRKMDRKPVSSS